jgi:serine/threonine protein kinase
MEQFGSVAAGSSTSVLPSGGAKPDQFGEYRLLRERCRGGMGIVYEAVQESLGRHVALKVLPFQAMLDPTHLERFRREAVAAARLHYTNIVPVFGVGEQHGLHYYAMQFIQGQGLHEVLQEVRRLRERQEPARDNEAEAPGDSGDGGSGAKGASSSESLLDRAGLSTWSDSHSRYSRAVALIGVRVTEALAYAHSREILHRDIKPSNLMFDTRGTVWVTDFGLAKAEGLPDLTHTGDVVGTLRYLAPERLHGESDPRSDIYSLGLTLYELLALRPAFAEVQRVRLLQQISAEEPPRPRRLDRRISRDLETIVHKAMAKEPPQRYGSARELVEDLRRFLADRPMHARRTRFWEQTRRWCRRNRTVPAGGLRSWGGDQDVPSATWAHRVVGADSRRGRRGAVPRAGRGSGRRAVPGALGGPGRATCPGDRFPAGSLFGRGRPGVAWDAHCLFGDTGPG